MPFVQKVAFQEGTVAVFGCWDHVIEHSLVGKGLRWPQGNPLHQERGSGTVSAAGNMAGNLVMQPPLPIPHTRCVHISTSDPTK